MSLWENFGDYVYVLAVLILLIVMTFVMLIVIPNSKVFYPLEEHAPEVITKIVDTGIAPAILEECNALKAAQGFDPVEPTVQEEGAAENQGDGKRKREILQRIVIYQNEEFRVPVTSVSTAVEALMEIPAVVRCEYLEIAKGKTPELQGGAFSNTTLRVVFPLAVARAQKAGVWVDGQKKIFVPGTPFLYDHSRVNSYYNTSRYGPAQLLLIDIVRPKSIPVGSSN